MMWKHKKVTCEVCYKEMRSDVKTRHMEQHSKGEDPNSATNTYIKNIFNTTPGVSKERKDEENEIKDEELKKYQFKIWNEYKRKLALGKQIHKMVGEGIAPYQALPSEMKEAVDGKIKRTLEKLEMLNSSPGRKAY